MTIVSIFLLFLSLARVLHIVGRELDPSWRGSVRDGDEEIRYRIGRNKGRLVSVTVGLALPGHFRFDLRPEGVFDPVARWLRLATEFQTRDSRFDDRVYIDCDDAALHDALVSNPKWRALIYSLLPIGTGRRLSCASGWIWITRPREDLESGDDDERIAREAARRYQPALRELRAELAKFSGEIRDPTRRARRRFAGVNVALLGAGVAGCICMGLKLDHQVVLAAIPRIAGWATAVTGAALLVILLLFLHGTARLHRLLADVVFAALPAAFVAAWGGAVYVNQAFDTAGAQRLSVPATGAVAVKGSKSTRYYLTVPAWPDARASREIPVRRDEYAVMEGRACVDVRWKSGRLGDPWIEGFMASEC